MEKGARPSSQIFRVAIHFNNGIMHRISYSLWNEEDPRGDFLPVKVMAFSALVASTR
jgi:hypothetical protein